jgi:predicted MFS family arabinose efflux permease
MGGIVKDSLGSDTAFFAMAMMLLNTGLLVMLLLPPRPRPEGVSDDYEEVADPRLPFHELIRRRFVQAVMVSGALGSLSFAASGAFLAVYVVSEEGLGTGSVAFVGVLFGARSLMGVIIEPFSGRLADRVDRVKMVMVGMIGAAAAQFLVPSVPSGTTEISLLGVDATIVPWLLVVYLALGIAEAIAFPAQSAIFVTVGRVTGMASVMGLQQTAWAVGFLGGSLLGALVVATFGIENVFRYAGILTFVGAAIFFVMIRRAADEIREAERIGAATLENPASRT